MLSRDSPLWTKRDDLFHGSVKTSRVGSCYRRPPNLLDKTTETSVVVRPNFAGTAWMRADVVTKLLSSGTPGELNQCFFGVGQAFDILGNPSNIDA